MARMNQETTTPPKHTALLWLAAAVFWLGGSLDRHGLLLPTVTPWSVAALALLTLLLCVLPQRALGRTQHRAFLLALLSLAILKSLALNLHHAPGLLARYYADSDFTPPHEASWRYPGLREQATRVDASLSFSNKGFSLDEQVFPLHFTNDWQRFNWRDKPEDDFRRKHFRFSAIWSGTITLPPDIQSLRWQAAAGEATLRIGKQLWASNGNRAERAPASSGTLPLVAEYRRTTDDAPALDLRWSRDGRHFEPVPPEAFSPIPGYANAHAPSQWLHAAACAGWFATLLVFAGLGIRWKQWRETNRERLVLLGLFALLATVTLIGHVHSGQQADAQIFTAGNDWLMYETQARAVLMGDWLNAGISDEKPFYMNVMYRYWLAGMHVLAGEDVLMVTWLQQLLMAGFLGLFYLSVRQAFSRPAALLASAFLLASGEILKFPSVLLDTTFSIALGYGALFSLIVWRRQGGMPRLLLSAVLLACAVATRANFLPFVVIAALWVAWPATAASGKPAARWHIPGALFMLAIGILPVLFTGWRNATVTGQWIWMPVSGPFNLWIGNHPPVGAHFEPFDFPPIPPRAEQGAIAIHYILSDPAALLYRIGYKLAYLFGIVIWKREIAPGIFIATTLALAGFAMALKRNTPLRPERLLLGLWVMMNFGALCLIFPWVYGWRLSGPTLPALAILAALAVLDGWQWMRVRKPLTPNQDCPEPPHSPLA